MASSGSATRALISSQLISAAVALIEVSLRIKWPDYRTAATGALDKPNAAGLPMALPNAYSKLIALVVVVVAHHRIGGHIDGKHRGELPEARFDPTAPVVEVSARVGVLTAEESTPHAAADHVIPRGVGKRNQGRAGAGHGRRMAEGGGMSTEQ